MKLKSGSEGIERKYFDNAMTESLHQPGELTNWLQLHYYQIKINKDLVPV